MTIVLIPQSQMLLGVAGSVIGGAYIALLFADFIKGLIRG